MNQPTTNPATKESKKDLSKVLQDKAGGKTTSPATSTNLPPAVVGFDAFRDFLDRHKQDFSMVIPSHLKPERVLRLAVSAARRTPELLSCDLATVVGGLLEATSLGLEVNTPLNHARLIPFRNNKTQKKEAQLVIEYRGYVELFYRHPKVLSVFANVVYTRDIFTLRYGTNEILEHTPLEESDRGEIKGFYAYIKMTDDAYRFIYLSKSEVDAIRDKYSAAYASAKKAGSNDTPWITDYEAMGMKTAIRRLERFVPKSPEIGRGVDADFKVIDPFDPNFIPPEDAEPGKDAD